MLTFHDNIIFAQRQISTLTEMSDLILLWKLRKTLSYSLNAQFAHISWKLRSVITGWARRYRCRNNVYFTIYLINLLIFNSRPKYTSTWTCKAPLIPTNGSVMVSPLLHYIFLHSCRRLACFQFNQPNFMTYLRLYFPERLTVRKWQ